MAYAQMPDLSLTPEELAALERSYRRDLQDMAAARASYASLEEVTARDEQEILRALARISYLMKQKTPLRLAGRYEQVIFA